MDRCNTPVDVSQNWVKIAVTLTFKLLRKSKNELTLTACPKKRHRRGYFIISLSYLFESIAKGA